MTSVTVYVTRDHFAHPRAPSGGKPQGGARAVPARGLAIRSRAASGITLAGTRTGAGGATLDWDRNGRVTPVRTASQEAWPGAEPDLRIPASAAVERRKASAPRMARTAPEAQANGDIGCAARTLCWCAFRRSAPLGSSRGNFGMALLLEWLWQSSDAKKAPRDRFVIASGAKQSRQRRHSTRPLDCFVACAPRNDAGVKEPTGTARPGAPIQKPGALLA